MYDVVSGHHLAASPLLPLPLPLCHFIMPHLPQLFPPVSPDTPQSVPKPEDVVVGIKDKTDKKWRMPCSSIPRSEMDLVSVLKGSFRALTSAAPLSTMKSPSDPFPAQTGVCCLFLLPLLFVPFLLCHPGGTVWGLVLQIPSLLRGSNNTASTSLEPCKD